MTKSGKPITGFVNLDEKRLCTRLCLGVFSSWFLSSYVKGFVATDDVVEF
jgi:hypothetical protein